MRMNIGTATSTNSRTRLSMRLSMRNRPARPKLPTANAIATAPVTKASGNPIARSTAMEPTISSEIHSMPTVLKRGRARRR